MPLKSQVQYDRQGGFTIKPPEGQRNAVDASSVWGIIGDVVRTKGVDKAVEIVCKAFVAVVDKDISKDDKNDSRGISGSIKRMYEMLGLEYMGDQLDAQDGGPGSGNFGHHGRPGKRGGSGKGGGKQYRSVQAQGLGGNSVVTGGKTGYGGTRKDWVNGLRGQHGARADKLVTKYASPAPSDPKKAKGFSPVDDADKKIMQSGSAAEKVEWLDLKSKARLFDPVKDSESKYTKQCLERLSDSDRKAFEHIISKYQTDPKTGQASEQLITGCVFDGVYYPGQAPDDVRDYYLSLKSKAMQGSDNGMQMPDELAYDMGIKPRPAQRKLPDWTQSISDVHKADVDALYTEYKDDIDKGKTLQEAVFRYGDNAQKKKLTDAYEEAIGWRRYGTRQKIRAQNTTEYDRAVFDLFHDRKIFEDSSHEQRTSVYLGLHAKQMGLRDLSDGAKNNIFNRVVNAGQYKTAFDGAKQLGKPKNYATIAASIAPGEMLSVELDDTITDKLTIKREDDGSYYINAHHKGDAEDKTAVFVPTTVSAIQELMHTAFDKRGCNATSAQKSKIPVPVKKVQLPAGGPQIAEKFKSGGSMVNYAHKVAQKTRQLFDGVKQETLDNASKTMTRLFQSPDTAFSMRFNAKHLTSILGTNFMSQVQLKDAGKRTHSGGYLEPEERARASTNMFGTYRKPGNGAQFEKYGYAGQTDFAKDYAMSGSTEHYGQVIVHFKKQNMFGRSTYTLGDSLGGGLASTTIPGLVGVDGITSGLGTNEGSSHRRLDKIASDQGYEKAGQGVQKLLNHSGAWSYLQMQYHGKLTIQQDAAEICFTKRDDLKYLTASNKKKLKAAGVKVYFLDRRTMALQDVSLD